MNTQAALTATIVHFMKELELSDADVAARCDLNISTIRRITRGTGTYSTPATAIKLMQGIGVPLQFFCEKFESFRES